MRGLLPASGDACREHAHAVPPVRQPQLGRLALRDGGQVLPGAPPGGLQRQLRRRPGQQHRAAPGERAGPPPRRGRGVVRLPRRGLRPAPLAPHPRRRPLPGRWGGGVHRVPQGAAAGGAVLRGVRHVGVDAEAGVSGHSGEPLLRHGEHVRHDVVPAPSTGHLVAGRGRLARGHSASEPQPQEQPEHHKPWQIAHRAFQDTPAWL
mmetsp:Transcript_51398/g.123691  ORF Transcript_51398/g.123691 Transcript_51398/m.123691 type:complete len:206 (-) Transcript_51398:179-796(-)